MVASTGCSYLKTKTKWGIEGESIVYYTMPICSVNIDKVWFEKIVGEWGEQMKKIFVSIIILVVWVLLFWNYCMCKVDKGNE